MSGIGRRQRTAQEIRALIEHEWTDRVGDCWEWRRCRTDKGYGLQGFEGKTWRAHRLSYFLSTGELPRLLRHDCDNPSCVNPQHLLSGTPQQNSDDAKSRGRKLGRKSTLTSEQRDEIRRRYTPYRGVSALAAEFGITRRHLNRVVNQCAS